MVETKILGRKISQVRKEKNLSQRDLAKLCDMTQTQICRIESGKQKPHLKTLAKISACLELNLRELTEEGLGYDEKDIKDEIYKSNQIILDKFSKLNSNDAKLVDELINKISIISEKEKAIIRLILSQECPP